MSLQRPFTRLIALPIAIAIVLLSALAVALLVASTRKADDAVLERQSHLLDHLLEQSREAVAREQEASTIWDDAVVRLNSDAPDLDWIDSNLGIWFGTYYHHDEVYVLRAADGPIYAMRGGRRVPASSYRERARDFRPVIDELQAKFVAGTPPEAGSASIGAARIATVANRPAIVSAKPIIAESADVTPARGRQSFHVAVRYLDGRFATNLQEAYLFDGATFIRDARARHERATLPVRDSGGNIIGYLAWHPDRPGRAMMLSLAPTLLAVLALFASIVVLLVLRARRSALMLLASEAQAHHLARHDALTGLSNRALFDVLLEQELIRVGRGNGRVALLYLDLDRFKNVNDSFGHPVGDRLIRAVAARLRAAVGGLDIVARIGGDEFAVIVTQPGSDEDVVALCDRIIGSFSEPCDLDGLTVHCTASLGAAVAPGDAVDAVELTRKADIALYEAKKNGRRRFARFVAAMDETVQRRREVEGDLRRALRTSGQLYVSYQPLISAKDGALAGVEALARWHHPVRGMISPSIFIPIAEETGLVEKLGLWVLREACGAVSLRTIPSLSINVSPVQLRNPAFSSQVLAILEQAGMPPTRLELELTETCLVGEAEEYRLNISRLRKEGVRIALDDFGTGYSSLTHLREFDIDRVKIDRSFIDHVEFKEDSRAIVKAIVELARATKLEVTAEGVERPAQQWFLREIGCNELQGFLLGRPMQLEELDDHLRTVSIAA